MRYFGSKVSTVDQLYGLIPASMAYGTVCDPFGGIGVVGAYFKQRGYEVWSGDHLTCAYYFQVARVQCDRYPNFVSLRKQLNLASSSDIVDSLNTAHAREGWLVQRYAEERRFFTRDNAERIEGCRQNIANWTEKGWLSASENATLRASLINSMDRVANTAGTYYAYLKDWHRKALQPFRFELLSPAIGNPRCRSFCVDATTLVAKRHYDILYLDPPYNDRSYAGYYHLPETIAIGDEPEIHGKSGVPIRTNPSSDFSRPGLALAALEQLLEHARFRLLVFHYSDAGLISPHDARCTLSKYGRIDEVILYSKGYTTAKEKRTVPHRVYLVTND